MPADHYPIRSLFIAISVLLVLGCASTFQPRPIEEVNFLAFRSFTRNLHRSEIMQ
jgi:hypothetical protein